MGLGLGLGLRLRLGLGLREDVEKRMQAPAKPEKSALDTCRSARQDLAYHMNNLHNLTVAQLREVVAIKEQIEKLQSELDSFIGGEGAPDAVRVDRNRASVKGSSAP